MSDSACTFDNPATMNREVWFNGKLEASYNMLELEAQGYWPPPPKMFHMGANIGPWKTGQIVGDPDAMRQ